MIGLGRHARARLQAFLRVETASGVLLLLAAIAAMAWANSSARGGYTWLWHGGVTVQLFGRALHPTLGWVVNDGLMAIFFLVVGLEIRRELYQGALSDGRRALLPAAAAVGGMVVPACVYLALAGAPDTRAGWGVPMATDIAFAVGIMSLLGGRVPAALRVLLLALAVIDDLGAIVIIALFYSAGLSWVGLAVAALGVAAVVGMRRWGVRRKVAYLVPGVVVWAGVHAAGIHPAIAGVALGLLTPVRAAPGEAASPVDALIATLHPWVSYAIMPAFALANAGVALDAVTFDGPSARVLLGAGLGLLVGKPVGVVLACLVALRLKVAQLPMGLGGRHLLVLGLVAGIGFTMALFIAQLGFPEDGVQLAAAKLGVLGGTVSAAVVGLLAGLVLLPASPDAPAPHSAV